MSVRNPRRILEDPLVPDIENEDTEIDQASLAAATPDPQDTPEDDTEDTAPVVTNPRAAGATTVRRAVAEPYRPPAGPGAQVTSPGLDYRAMAAASPHLAEIYAPQVRQQTADENAQARADAEAQRAAERQQRAEAAAQVKAQNSETLARYQAEKRPHYVDPATGLVVPKNTDEEWEAGKEQRRQNDALRQQYYTLGRPYTIDKTTGAILPKHSDEEWQQIQDKKHLADEIKGVRYETADALAGPRKVLTETERKKLEKDYAQTTKDAIDTALAPALANAAKTQEGGILGFGQHPTAGAQQAADRAAKLNEARANADANKTPAALDDADLADLKKINPDLHAKLTTRRDQLAVDDDNRVWHETQKQKEADLKLRFYNPEAWKKKHLADIEGVITPAEAGAQAVARGTDLETRLADFDQKARDLAAAHQTIRDGYDQIEAENQQAVARGLRADEMTTLVRNGQPETWSKTAAQKLLDHQTAAAEAEKTLAPAREALDAHARILQQDQEIAHAAADHAAALIVSQRSSEIEKVRRTPGLSHLADRLASLDADAAQIHEDLQNMPDGPEKDEATQQAKDYLEANQRDIADQFSAKEQAGKQLYDSLHYAPLKSPGIAGAADAMMREKVPGHFMTEEGEHGIAPAVESAAAGLANAGAGAAGWLLSKIAGPWDPAAGLLKDDPKTAEAIAQRAEQFGLSPEEAKHWIAQHRAADFTLGNTADLVRTLPDGSIAVNPANLHDRAAIEKAIDGAPATADAKATAKANLGQMRDAFGQGLYDLLSQDEGYKAAVDTMPGDTPAQKALAYDDAVRTGGAAWLTKIQKSFSAGAHGLAASLGGAFNALTGSGQLLRDYMQHRAAAAATTASFVQGNLATNLIAGAAEMAPGLIFPMGIGAAAQRGMLRLGALGARAGAGTAEAAAIARRAQFVGANVNAATFGLQSFGGTFNEAYAAATAQGATDQEARQKALAPAIATGLVTTGIFSTAGANGFAALLRIPQAAAKKAALGKFFEKGLGEMAKDYGLHATAEAVKLGASSLADSIVASQTFRPDMTPKDMIQHAIEAGETGALFGLFGAWKHRGAMKKAQRAHDQQTQAARQDWADRFNEDHKDIPGFKPVAPEDFERIRDAMGTPEVQAHQSALTDLLNQRVSLVDEIKKTAPESRSPVTANDLQDAQAAYDKAVIDHQAAVSAGADPAEKEAALIQAKDALDKAQRAHAAAVEHDTLANAGSIPDTPTLDTTELERAVTEAQHRVDEEQGKLGTVDFNVDRNAAAIKDLQKAKDALDKANQDHLSALGDDIKNVPHRELRRKIERLKALDAQIKTHATALDAHLAKLTQAAETERVAVQKPGAKTGQPAPKTGQTGQKGAQSAAKKGQPSKSYGRALTKPEIDEARQITAFLVERRGIAEQAARAWAEHHVRRHSTSKDYTVTALDVEKAMKIAGQGDIRNDKAAVARAMKALAAEQGDILAKEPAPAATPADDDNLDMTPAPPPVKPGADLLNDPAWPQAQSAALSTLKLFKTDAHGNPTNELDPAGTARLRKNGKAALVHLDKILARYGPLFPGGVRLADPAAGPHHTALLSARSPMHVVLERGKAQLIIHLPYFLRDYARSADPKAIRTVIEEELIHRVTLEKFDARDLAAFWSRIPKEIRNQVWRGYHAWNIKDGTVPADVPDLSPQQSANMAHEFLRMLVQDSHFRGRVSEMVDTDPSLGSFLLDLLQNLLKGLRDLIKRAPAGVRADIAAYEAKATAALKDLLKTLPPEQKGISNKSQKSAAPAPADETQPPAGPVTFTGPASTETYSLSSAKPNGAKVDFRWRVESAATLKPLLQATINTAQTRQRRGNKNSQEQVQKIRNGADPALLMDSPTGDTGAPAVDRQAALAGNGRLEGLILGYQDKNASSARYRAAIIKKAADLGLAGADQIPDPILIREVVRHTAGTREDFVDENNPKDKGLAETPAEGALRDAKALGDLSGLKWNEDGNLSADSAQEVHRRLIAAQRGVTTNLAGKPVVAEATKRVQLAALANLAKAGNLDVADFIGLLENDQGRRAVSDVVRAAPSLQGLDPDLALATDALAALRELQMGLHARETKAHDTLEAWHAHRKNELIGSELSEAQERILDMMVLGQKKPGLLRSFFEAYLSHAKHEQAQRDAERATGDIFGEQRKNAAAASLIGRAAARIREELASGQGDVDRPGETQVAAAAQKRLDRIRESGLFTNDDAARHLAYTSALRSARKRADDAAAIMRQMEEEALDRMAREKPPEIKDRPTWAPMATPEDIANQRRVWLRKDGAAVQVTDHLDGARRAQADSEDWDNPRRWGYKEMFDRGYLRVFTEEWNGPTLWIDGHIRNMTSAQRAWLREARAAWALKTGKPVDVTAGRDITFNVSEAIGSARKRQDTEQPPPPPDYGDLLRQRDPNALTRAIGVYKSRFAQWVKAAGQGAFIGEPAVYLKDGPTVQLANVVTRIPGKDGWRSTSFSRYTGQNAPDGDYAGGAWVPTGHMEYATKLEAFEDARTGMADAAFTSVPLFAAPKRRDQLTREAKAYEKLFALEQAGQKLTPQQRAIFERAEDTIGQALLFSRDDFRAAAPAEDLRLESQTDSTSWAPQQLSLFAGQKRREESLPDYIKPLAIPSQNAMFSREGEAQNHPAQDALRHPGGSHGGHGAPERSGEGPLGGRPQHEAHPQPSEEYQGLREYDGQALARALQAVPSVPAGQEHIVYRDGDLAIKLTKPGETGARRGVADYLAQQDYINAKLGDDAHLLGYVYLPGEDKPRLLTVQTWYHGRESTPEEIDSFMRHKGFLMAFQGTWFDPRDETKVSDADPRNFITVRHPDGSISVHPVDLITSWPTRSFLEMVENQVAAHKQPEPIHQLSSDGHMRLPGEADNLQRIAAVIPPQPPQRKPWWKQILTGGLGAAQKRPDYGDDDPRFADLTGEYRRLNEKRQRIIGQIRPRSLTSIDDWNDYEDTISRIPELGPINRQIVEVENLLRTLGHRGFQDLWVLAAGRKHQETGDLAGDYPEIHRAAFRPHPETPAVEFSNAVLTGPDLMAGIKAWHGTRHTFDRFRTERIGSGEGAQVYGWGLYFAENRKVGEAYFDSLGTITRKHNTFDGDRLTYKKLNTLLRDADPDIANVALAIGTRLVTSKDIRPLLDERIDQAKKEIAHFEAGLRERLYRRSNGEQIIATWTDQDYEDRIKYTTAWLRQLEKFRERAQHQPERKNGSLYEVELDGEKDHYLDWDKPLKEQSDYVKKALADAWLGHPESHAELTGQQIYGMTRTTAGVTRSHESPDEARAASNMLAEAGIKGIRYLDEGSRNHQYALEAARRRVKKWQHEVEVTGNRGPREELDRAKSALAFMEQKAAGSTYNYVVFDDKDIKIKARNGQPINDALNVLSLFAGRKRLAGDEHPSLFDFTQAPRDTERTGRIASLVPDVPDSKLDLWAWASDATPSHDVPRSTPLESDRTRGITDNAGGQGRVRTRRRPTLPSRRPLDERGDAGRDTADRGPLSADVPAADVGERSDPELRIETPEPQRGPAGSERPGGSREHHDQGQAPDAPGPTDPHPDLVPPPAGSSTLAPGRPGSEGSVDRTAGTPAGGPARKSPLTPEQHGDVEFIERRLIENSKPGVLITNGTGTGKTFTGLGAIQRALDRGARHILVVAPSDKVCSDWIDTAKTFFGIHDAYQLEGINDNGGDNRLVITTYANLGQNPSLIHRPWDLVASDEAHYLSQAQNGATTNALQAFRALTWHKDGLYTRAEMLHPELVARRGELSAIDHRARTAAQQSELDRINNTIADTKLRLDSEHAALGEARRPKALLISATPFAYHFSLDYAEGYLFDHGPEPQGGGYNQPSARDAFYITHFGYRMRTGKLTQPENATATSILERRFAEHLMRQGAMSGRALEVPFDYSRKFILVDSAIGTRIDQIMEALQSTPRFQLLAKRIGLGDYLARRYLLEGLKAKEAIARIKQHLALGRKVVVFHDYKKGAARNPLAVTFAPDATDAYYDPDARRSVQVNLADLFAEFKRTVGDYDQVKDALSGLGAPIDLIRRAFPDAGIYNGSVSKGDRRKIAAAFNKSGGKMNVILVQRASGKEGISLHDRDGKHQRVFLDLGIPGRPTDAIQSEGRIYRHGLASNAVIEYLSTGTAFERWTFAQTIAQRASTAENLAMGERARALLQSFASAYNDAEYEAPNHGQGTGGKAADHARDNGDPFDNAVALFYTNQKKTSRNKSSEGQDYYATPEPVGFKMVEWAGLKPGEKALEPSAGHGAIARFFPDATNRHAVEPSNELAGRLALNAPDTEIHQHRFEDFNTINKFDGIVMNPPFGTAGKTAMEHLIKATEHLRDGGRIVALIPRGSMDQRFDAWRESDAAEDFHLRAEILLPGSTFSRAGTGVSTRIVVIDKAPEKRYLAAGEGPRHIDLSGAADHKELFDRLRNIDVPPRPERIPAPDYDTTEDQDAEAINRAIDAVSPYHSAGQVATLAPSPDEPHLRRWSIGKGWGSQTEQIQARLGPKFKVINTYGYGSVKRIHAPEAAPPAAEPPAQPDRDAIAALLSGRDGKLPSAGDRPAAPVNTASTNVNIGQHVSTPPPAALPTPARESLWSPVDFAHTQTGETQFAVKINRRLTDGQFAQAKNAAKALGGYYSRYKGRGAVPGFIFKSPEARDQFIGSHDIIDPGPLAAAPKRTEADHDEGQEAQNSVTDARAHEAATSPHNDLPQPSPDQKDAGNYKMGHLRVAGLDVTIENPQGSVRSGVTKEGKPWSTTLQDHYGYLKRTEGKDGDQLDIFVKPGTPEDWRGPVYVINQNDPTTGKFDEHKAVIGAASRQEASDLYHRNYQPGWKGFGSIVELPIDKFKSWALDRKRIAPAGGTSAHENAPGRGTPWPEDFPDVMVHTTADKLQRHPDFNAAKAGDIPAAMDIARSFIKPDTAVALARRFPGAILASVHAEEATGRNQIPLAMAHRIGELTGLEVDDDIVQTNRVHHRGASAMDRLLRVPEFSGRVQPGRTYIIIDDVATSGSSLASLRDYIERNGGRVVLATTYAASSNPQTGYGGHLALQHDTRENLTANFDKPALEAILERHGIASSIEALTNSQGRYVASFGSAQSFGDRLAQRAQSGIPAQDAGAEQGRLPLIFPGTEQLRLFAGQKRAGRAQPLTDRVRLDATHSVPIADLEPDGQRHVFIQSPAGGLQEVRALYHQGSKPVYRLTLQNQASARFTRDHIFVVKLDDRASAPLNMRLADIIDARNAGRTIYLPVMP